MRRRQQFLAEFCADRLELVRPRPIDPKPGIHWFSDDPALDPPVPEVLFKVMEAEDEQSLRRSHDLRALALVLRAHRDAMEQLFEDVIEGTPDPQERHVLQKWAIRSERFAAMREQEEPVLAPLHRHTPA